MMVMMVMMTGCFGKPSFQNKPIARENIHNKITSLFPMLVIVSEQDTFEGCLQKVLRHSHPLVLFLFVLKSARSVHTSFCSFAMDGMPTVTYSRTQ